MKIANQKPTKANTKSAVYLKNKGPNRKKTYEQKIFTIQFYMYLPKNKKKSFFWGGRSPNFIPVSALANNRVTVIELRDTVHGSLSIIRMD